MRKYRFTLYLLLPGLVLMVLFGPTAPSPAVQQDSVAVFGVT